MKITPLAITGYRFRWSAPRGVAGTFYYTHSTMTEMIRDGAGIDPKRSDFLEVLLTFQRCLVVSEKELSPYHLAGVEMATRWFPGRDFREEAYHKLGAACTAEHFPTDTLLMDIAVAMEATRRGVDGILYRMEEIVDLRHLLEAGLTGPDGERRLITAIVEKCETGGEYGLSREHRRD